MQRSIVFAVIAGLSSVGAASAQTAPPAGYVTPVTPPMVVVAQPPVMKSDLGGGLHRILCSAIRRRRRRRRCPAAAGLCPAGRRRRATSSCLRRFRCSRTRSCPTVWTRVTCASEVDYRSDEKPGTVIIDTPNKFLYLIEPHGKAIRYGIGVGRPGFTWAGVHKVSAKKEWPDWVPPAEMIERQPYLPHFMAGGPDNPLGARALYLGSTLYRIHGSNEPWTIGQNVSSGCIRLRNADIIDLYDRVKVGATVVVL